MAKKITKDLFKTAQNYLVGGVSSPVRAFHSVGGQPVLIKEGRGSKIIDYDGKEYIDYCISWGSILLGHANPSVIRKTNKAMLSGLSFGTTNKKEIELAALIHDAIPPIEKLRFVNSGTEAVMGAVRLARGSTGRDKIVKFENSYHGHADYLLVKGGSGLATLQISSSAGVPVDFVRHTLQAPYGDKEAIYTIFKQYGDQIAAVIFEPVGGNYGVIPPDIDFIKYLRQITNEHGALLIADEIITGFRFNFGSFTYELGTAPDLICLGKILGGGLPIGAYGGNKKIMDNLAPLGNVYQASTFSGNPIVMQAGLSTLHNLKNAKNKYLKVNKLTSKLVEGIREAAQANEVDGLKIEQFGSMFSFQFADKEMFAGFYQLALAKGIYFAPSQFESNFLSFAHTSNDISTTVAIIKEIFLRNKKIVNLTC